MSPVPTPSPSPMSLYEGMTLRDIKKLPDAQALSMPQDIVLAASKSVWRAPIYAHYEITSETRADKNGEKSIWYRFTCKANPIRHKAQYRARSDDSSGTHKFITATAKCNANRNIVQDSVESTVDARKFSPARLRALLALWCARNHRPFEVVNDDLFIAITNELRPGTALPDPTTLSRDVQRIYQQNMEAIRRYFQLRRAILEFIQLTKRHTGEYLALKTSECLNRYDLGTKVLTVCMDNASNNNTFTTELQKRFPSFGGSKFRTRCGAHIVNLMAKAYLSIFSKPAARKRVAPASEVVSVASNKRRRPNSNTADAANIQPLEECAAGGDLESKDCEGPVDDVDENKLEYDNATVKVSVVAAFSEVEKLFGITVSESERQMAQQLLPKISGLANRAKVSPVVQHKFEHYATSIPGLSRSPHPTLPCSVATRWNTELMCIRGHVHKRAAVKQLTADRDLSLREYQLSDPQWDLSEQLVSELRIFERLTHLFSETQVPLIHQVVPALLKLRDRLQATIKSPAPGLHPLLRVASYAALKVFDKYMRLFEDASIYWVAIVMCPHYKLDWFRSRSYSESDTRQIELLTCSTFEHVAGTWTDNQSEGPEGENHLTHLGYDESLADDWLSDDEIGSMPVTRRLDTIQDYLNAPLVHIEALRRGGLLAYWNEQQRYSPRVARFALSILSAPASSVDAERAFSGGRLTINHLQHSMADTTFEAKMAVGSWYNTPLLPSVDTAATIITEKLRH